MHAASKLDHLPVCVQSEKQSGISMVRLLNSIAEDKDKISDLLSAMSSMGRKLFLAAIPLSREHHLSKEQW